MPIGTARTVLVLLAVAIVLTGCASPSDPRAAGEPARRPGTGQSGTGQSGTGQSGTGQSGTGLSGTGLSALRAGLRRGGAGAPYYLALGDSLSRGVQPGPTGRDRPTGLGYPDQLASRLRDGLPGLRLVDFGCSGETTSTMITGGLCRYPAGSQLAQATAFLRSHRGAVALVTIDIGANDPNSCVRGAATPSAVLSCLSARITRTERNLAVILASLRAAAGRRVLIVGMTYYVPELGLWQAGQAGKAIAVVTDDFVAGADRMLIARYRRYGARVADVFGAFRSADFTEAASRPAGGGPASAVPANVTIICTLTWMCAPAPRGPDEHANAAGYGVIARAFWQAISR